MHTLSCIPSLCISHHVICDVSHATLFMSVSCHTSVACCTACMHTSLYMLLGLKLATIALGIAGFARSRCDLSVLVNRPLLQLSHRLGTSAHSDSQQEQLQRAGHEPVLPCACLWTSTCLCLTAPFGRASIHILRALLC